MEFFFSKHSLEQIQLRGLSSDVVDDILYFPDSVLHESDEVHVFQKLVLESDKTYLYRIFVNIGKAPPLVITAYKTSKTVKYENQI
jgi:hypothetical protein